MPFVNRTVLTCSSVRRSFDRLMSRTDAPSPLFDAVEVVPEQAHDWVEVVGPGICEHQQDHGQDVRSSEPVHLRKHDGRREDLLGHAGQDPCGKPRSRIGADPWRLLRSESCGGCPARGDADSGDRRLQGHRRRLPGAGGFSASSSAASARRSRRPPTRFTSMPASPPAAGWP